VPVVYFGMTLPYLLYYNDSSCCSIQNKTC